MADLEAQPEQYYKKEDYSSSDEIHRTDTLNSLNQPQRITYVCFSYQLP